MIDRAWFSRHLRNLARKWCGSILTTQSLQRASVRVFFFFFFSGLHHCQCIAPLVANSLQSGQF